MIAPLDVVLTFESSARWPDEVDAIRATKTAFALRIAERLTVEHRLRTSVTNGYMYDVFFSFFFVLNNE